MSTWMSFTNPTSSWRMQSEILSQALFIANKQGFAVSASQSPAPMDETFPKNSSGVINNFIWNWPKELKSCTNWSELWLTIRLARSLSSRLIFRISACRSISSWTSVYDTIVWLRMRMHTSNNTKKDARRTGFAKDLLEYTHQSKFQTWRFPHDRRLLHPIVLVQRSVL